MEAVGLSLTPNRCNDVTRKSIVINLLSTRGRGRGGFTAEKKMMRKVAIKVSVFWQIDTYICRWCW